MVNSKKNEAEKTRKLAHKPISYEGKNYIEFKEVGCSLRNGVTKGDLEGAQTYMSEECFSVLKMAVEIERERKHD